MGEAPPPRLLWINGPPFVGKRTLAGHLRDRWNVVALDAEAVGFTLLEGMPAGQGAVTLQDSGLWLWAMWRLGVEMARNFGLVVVPAGLHRPATVIDLLSWFRRQDLDVLHVVLEADDTTMRARIHGHDVDVHAKRWALEHLRPATTALAEVHDGIRLDTTSRTPHQLTDDLAHLLVQHGWLTQDTTWTPPSGGRK